MYAWLLGALLGCADTVYEHTPAPPPDPQKAPPPEGAERCATHSPNFPSHGVHSPCGCPDGGCDAARSPGDPPDPQYPEHWIAKWTMYRVFSPQPDNPPPYADPPAGLEAGTDYEASSGVTYYDSAYVPADKDGVGAMLARYEGRCLPIFPIENDFGCTFASLGNKTWMLTDEADRPEGMAACCLFSAYHHAPRRDFVRHLPYAPEDSARLDGTLQAYRYTVSRQGTDIWFGYAFHRDQHLDPEGQYLRPHSSYSSGAVTDPPRAPVISQNYTDFEARKPDPSVWEPVAAACGGESVPVCNLFDADPARFMDTPEQLKGLLGSGWEDIYGGPPAPPPPSPDPEP